MTKRTFSLVAGWIFLLIAVLHAARLVFHWDAAIGGWTVPQWVSGVAVIVAGYLASQGLKSRS